MEFVRAFKAARKAGTPLIAVRTPDPQATIDRIISALNGDAPAVLSWDISRGVRGLNEPGEAAVSANIQDPQLCQNPSTALEQFGKLPDRSICFMHNMHRVIGEQGISQALWNLRDPFKSTVRTLVMLCPDIALPSELSQDVLILDEPLPTNAELAGIVNAVYEGAGLAAPSEETVAKCVDAMCGLAAFPAEQAASMAITKNGMDLADLWERKRQMVEATPGLSIYRGKERFDDIGGCENIKRFIRGLLNGNDPPRAVVFQDEVN